LEINTIMTGRWAASSVMGIKTTSFKRIRQSGKPREREEGHHLLENNLKSFDLGGIRSRTCTSKSPFSKLSNPLEAKRKSNPSLIQRGYLTCLSRPSTTS